MAQPAALIHIAKSFHRWTWLFAAATLAVLALACRGGGGAAEGPVLSGSIEIDGSSTVFPITQAMAEEFRKGQPGVQISAGISGTGGGFKRFVRGEIEIADASRKIKESEVDQAKANGIEFVEIAVAFDGLAVLVNPRNEFVTCLTVAELKRIWAPESRVRNWRQVRPEFPDLRLELYGPGTDSGTFDYFTEAIVGKEDASRADFTASEDDNVLVYGVAGDRHALGYFGYAYYAENRQILNVVAIDGGKGCVVPSEETIRNQSYAPLSRPLYIYVNKEAIERPEVKAFVRYYLESAVDLVSEVGYVPLPESDYQAAKARIAD
ncbi:MAG: PstS family phosphate ABC transporter substrate-binding protein [Chloroflexi bacterium]|nr:PstS family phosphate ABC transporter substrate-binding protein [Chloroflexota bacterium]